MLMIRYDGQICLNNGEIVMKKVKKMGFEMPVINVLLPGNPEVLYKYNSTGGDMLLCMAYPLPLL